MHPCFNHGEFTSEANVDQEMKDQAIQWTRVMYATKCRPATVAAAVGAAAAVAVQDGPPEEPAKKKRKVRGLLGLMALPDAAQSAPIGQPPPPPVCEMEEYLGRPQVEQTEDFDLLAWWKGYEHRAPNRARMAK